jgi:hypothetical protein
MKKILAILMFAAIFCCMAQAVTVSTGGKTVSITGAEDLGVQAGDSDVLPVDDGPPPLVNVVDGTDIAIQPPAPSRRVPVNEVRIEGKSHDWNGTNRSIRPAEWNDTNRSDRLGGRGIRPNITRTENGLVLTLPNGKTIEFRRDGNKTIVIKAGDNEVRSDLEIDTEGDWNGTEIRVHLSNGRNAEVKIMPSTASERALERLKLKVCTAENNCTIELKETGHGNETKATYEIKARQKAKLLGFIQTHMDVDAQVDSETGDVLKSHRPWWAFMATTQ